MRQVCWLTDLHFAAAEPEVVANFMQRLKQEKSEDLFITGDLSDGDEFVSILPKLAEMCSGKVYFVLGNHDFYGCSIAENRKKAVALSEKRPNIVYLTNEDLPLELTKESALIGHDGWSDGQCGDFLRSDIVLNDYILIEELKGLDPKPLLAVLKKLGEEAAAALKVRLVAALAKYERVVLLCHTPPTAEAARYDGHPADQNWAPHFVGHAVGEAVKTVMAGYPDKHLLFLCGHAHYGADIHLLPNLHVITGRSKTGIPRIQQTFEIA
jgi:Icc protein